MMSDRTARDRAVRRPLAALGIFVLSWGAPALADFGFQRHEVVIGSAQHQTVLTGFVLGGEVADLIAVQSDESGSPTLHIYAADDEGWQLDLEAKLEADVRFVDIVTIAGQDRLVTYAPGRLCWFDPESASEQTLVEIPASYNAAPSGLRYGSVEPMGPIDPGEIPHVDISLDLNVDGQDDLVLPAWDGFWVVVQQGDGRFAKPVKLGPREPFRDVKAFDDTRSYGEVGITPLTIPWYLSRIHRLDYDHDGRSDLLFWNEDRFDVFLQSEDGLFEPSTKTFVPGVSFDSDGVYSLLFAFSDASSFSLVSGFRAKTSHTVLHSFADINADGVADLVTMTLTGRSVLRLRSTFAVHYGEPIPGGIQLSQEPSTVVGPMGKSPPGFGYSSIWLQDFDGDDQVDVLFCAVKTGFVGIIRALLGRSATLSCELYRLTDGMYPDEHSAKRTIRSSLEFGDGRDEGFFPFALIGDVNGDGRSDLLVGKKRQELLVYLVTAAPELLTRRPLRMTVTLPGDERNSRLVDLNRDGKEDLLTHHPSKAEPHRVTLMIAE